MMKVFMKYMLALVIILTCLSPLASQVLEEINRNITITCHVVRDSDGELVDTAALREEIVKLNTACEKIKLSFSYDLRIVENTNLHSILNFDVRLKDLLAQSYQPNTLNVYFVGIIPNDTMDYYMDNSASRDFILIKKSPYEKKGNFIEYVGKFFDLYNTHESDDNGPELVDRTANCSTTGDLCCDTPADPDLEGLVSMSCLYIGTARDLNGERYIPTVANYMSNAPYMCRCKFSDQQLLRMMNFIKTNKNYFW